MKQFSKKKGWELPEGIVFDEQENKFVKGDN